MADFPVLTTARFQLSLPPPAAAPRLLAFAVENDAHLAPWSPPAPDGYFTEAYWRKRLAQSRDEIERGAALRFVITARGEPDGAVVGLCNFTQIVRGAFQACTLGYSVDHRWEGRGAMTESLQAAIAFVFGPMRLHRIMANYRPTNERSGRLLRRLGFVVEGYARDYLFIDGAWRDHVLTALTHPSPAPPL